MQNDKFLTIVNSKNKFSDEMLSEFDFRTTSDYYGTTKMVTEAYVAFKKLQKVMNDKYNIALSKNSVFRNVSSQQAIYEEIKKKYGEEYANKTVAKPDESEHLLGLAIDVAVHPMHTRLAQHIYNAPLFAKISARLFKVEQETKMNMYKKLHGELADCGFILRYTTNKSSITGVETNEYWHIRYVGVKHAKEIERLGMCLEEYVEYLRENSQSETALEYREDKE